MITISGIVSALEALIESEVAEAAVAVQTTAAATARWVADGSDGRASDVARVARDARGAAASLAADQRVQSIA